MPEGLNGLHQHAFYGTLMLLALLELWLPLRGRRVDLAVRWPSNLALFAFNVALYRLALPVSAIELAQAGLFDGGLLPLPVAGGVGIVVTVLLLDFWKYVEHWLFHSCAPLWRVHLVHHVDTEVDFTTSERHHPLEVLVGYPVILGFVAVFGLPAEGVALFAILSSVVSLWSHADVRWPPALEALVRKVFVTPDMHVVHHSAMRAETDSNYGQIFSFWDRLFGTYVAPTPQAAARRVLGLEYFRSSQDLRPLRTFLLPFVRLPGGPQSAGDATRQAAE